MATSSRGKKPHRTKRTPAQPTTSDHALMDDIDDPDAVAIDPEDPGTPAELAEKEQAEAAAEQRGKEDLKAAQKAERVAQEDKRTDELAGNAEASEADDHRIAEDKADKRLARGELKAAEDPDPADQAGLAADEDKQRAKAAEEAAAAEEAEDAAETPETDDAKPAKTSAAKSGTSKTSKSKSSQASDKPAKTSTKAKDPEAKKGRKTPKRTSRAGSSAKRASGRKQSTYTSADGEQTLKPNPRWFVPAMLSILGLGLLWLVIYYVSGGKWPVEAWGNWNLLAGFSILVVGLGMSTRWR